MAAKQSLHPANLADNTQKKYHSMAERQTRQAAKMTAVCSLAQGLVHEFNNLLGTMIGSAEMIQDEVEPESFAAKDVARLLRAGDRAKDLVSLIRSLYHRHDHDLPPTDLCAATKKAIESVQPNLPDNIDLKWRITPPQAVTDLNQTEVQQIIHSLCTNSSQAIGKRHGRIDIFLEEIGPGNDLQPLLNNIEKAILLTVRDSGQGMDDQILERMFEPFFSTRQGSGLTGMGLASIYAIVNGVGGVIVADSTLGLGTSMLIALPLSPSPPKDLTNTNSDTEKPHQGKERILMVDDDHDLLELQERRLTNLGYQVTTMQNSQEALDLFKQAPQSFDLVITDQSMPKYSGKELAKQICQIRPDIPIILCTGGAEEQIEPGTEECNIQQTLYKPLNKHDLAKAIQKALNS